MKQTNKQNIFSYLSRHTDTTNRHTDTQLIPRHRHRAIVINGIDYNLGDSNIYPCLADIEIFNQKQAMCRPHAAHMANGRIYLDPGNFGHYCDRGRADRSGADFTNILLFSE